MALLRIMLVLSVAGLAVAGIAAEALVDGEVWARESAGAGEEADGQAGEEALVGEEAAPDEGATSGVPGAADAAITEPLFRVSRRLSRRTVAVGDTFRLNLDLDWRDGVEVKPLAIGDKVGGFTVRDVHYGVAVPEGGRLRRSASLLLTVFETGKQTVPAIPVIYLDEAGGAQKAEAPPIDVEVVSVLPEDAADIKDIKGPISVPKRWKDLILSYALLVGLVAGAATSVLVSMMRREQIEAFLARVWRRVTAPLRRLILWLLAKIGLIRRPESVFDVRVTEPDLIPEEAALRELDRIDLLGLLEKDMVKEHYTLVSETVRRYVERKYGILAMESPTSFTMLALSEIPLAEEGCRLLGDVLEEGDMVKFAKHVPAHDLVESITQRARRIVHITGDRHAVAAVGSGAGPGSDAEARRGTDLDRDTGPASDAGSESDAGSGGDAA